MNHKEFVPLIFLDYAGYKTGFQAPLKEFSSLVRFEQESVLFRMVPTTLFDLPMFLF